MSSTVLVKTSAQEIEECPRCECDMVKIRPACFHCDNCGAEQTCEDL